MLGTVGSELTVMGDAVNTAARLQTAAEPGQVLVGEATRAACGPGLRFREIGDLTVKGKARVVTSHEPIGAAAGPSRRGVVNTPLVGRAPELGAMVACWRTACRTATPHTITLLGEAGVGKSRLLTEWAAVAAQGGTVLTGRCLPYGEVVMRMVDFLPQICACTSCARTTAPKRPRSWPAGAW
jgi:hypothetical protein